MLVDIDLRAPHGSHVPASLIRRRVVVLLLVLSAWLAPAGANAATLGPGGIAGATLWFAASDYTGTTWPDRSGSGAVTSAATAPSGGASPSTIPIDVNGNPGVGFDGSTQSLRGTLSSSAFGSAGSYIFAVSNSSVYSPSASTWGDVLSGYNGPGQGIEYSGGAYGADSDGSFGPGPFTIPSASTTLSDVYYPTAGSALNATAAENGVSTSASSATTLTAATQFEIGARTSGGFTSRLFAGTVDEIIYFKTLAAANVSKIRSYLAIKYGITLGYNAQTGVATPTDYVNSVGTTIWSSSLGAAYHHNVFGIERDDNAGLNQQVSSSTILTQSGNPFNMTVAAGTSATSPSAFPADKQSLVMGDNGLGTTMSNHSGIFRMDRIWLGQSLTNVSHLYFQMPASAFTGVSNPSLWVWTGNPATNAPIYQGAMTCTASICYVTVGAGVGNYYFSFGQLQVSGTVFEDPNYGGGSGRAWGCSGCTALGGVRVELYSGGAFSASTTTASDGSYLFLVNPGTTDVVRVVTPTTSSRSGGSTAGIAAVQTFRTSATGGTASAVTDHVGGETPNLADAAANTSNATLASLTTATTTAQSITTAAVSTAMGVLNMNFGYNFDTVVNNNPSGQGSLAQFITNANALGGVSSLVQVGQTAGTQTSIFMIGNGIAHSGLHTGSTAMVTAGVAVITLTSALPAIAGASTVIDGTTETANDGNTNSGTFGTGGTVGTDLVALTQESKPTVQITGTSASAPGLSITASTVTIRGIAITSFGSGGSTNNGDIAISGTASSTLIEKNVIGTTATAFTAAGGSGGNGIVATSSGGGTIQNNVIGFMSGVPVVLSATSGWTVSGNEIRGAQGSAAYSGVRVASTTGSTISNNLIAANPAGGISTSGTTASLTITDNNLTGNGVSISTATSSKTPGIDLIGTGTTVSKNVISSNYGAGVLVESGSVQNTITQNSIYSNGTVSAANGAAASGEIGVDLLGASDTASTGTSPFITPNRSGGTGTGGNNLFDFPILDGAVLANGTLTLTGYARAGATIEVFIADTNPTSGFGQGKTYVTTLTEGASSGNADSDATSSSYSNPGGNTNVGTDTTNRFRFAISAPPGVSINSVLTADEYLAADGTSEFGPNIVVGSSAPAPAVGTVLSVLPSGLQSPGTTLTYTGVFTNGGTGSAYNFSIVDPIPSNTDFQVGSAGAVVTNANLTYAVQYATDAACSNWSLGYAPVGGTGGAPAGYDRSVTGVRFNFSGSFGFSSPYNSGSFSLAVRIQ